MIVTETSLPGVLLIEPSVFVDSRGLFLETGREDALARHGLPAFVQDNQSRSRRGVLRGLHYQLCQPQGKLVRVARGAVFDVVLDVRHGSPDFGKWLGMILDDVSHRQLYSPPGFAHGFVVLSDEADLVYRCSDYYHPASEHGVAWDDPDLAIQWPAEIRDALLLSERDRCQPRLRAKTPQQLPVYRGDRRA